MEHSDQFRNKLINWYFSNRRMLPWRETSDPYNIWVSEIMLQQTRVSQGLDYYKRFIERFPNVRTLAAAPEQEVLKSWEGLGYYSRARHMHETARYVVRNLNGMFPERARELIKLKGIGNYTAAAIASIAFNEKVAVVDGNVIRFVSRLTGIQKPVDNSDTLNLITRIVNSMIAHDDPGTFNQAMMEFGALQCIPGRPKCGSCPFVDVCLAYRNNLVDQIPNKEKQTKITHRYFNYLVITRPDKDETCFIIKPRKEPDIWRNLYDFPLIEATKLLSRVEVINSPQFIVVFGATPVSVKAFPGFYKHILTHRIIHARFFKTVLNAQAHVVFPESYICTGKIRQYPLPRLISRFIDDHLPDQQNTIIYENRQH